MKRYKNFLLALAVIVITVVPLCMSSLHKPDGFSGSDDQATDAIAQAYQKIHHQEYHRWFKPLFEPPSGEVESFLFALQAAMGAGILCYYIGLNRGRREQRETKKGVPSACA